MKKIPYPIPTQRGPQYRIGLVNSQRLMGSLVALPRVVGVAFPVIIMGPEGRTILCLKQEQGLLTVLLTSVFWLLLLSGLCGCYRQGVQVCLRC